jgi:hypothetical protein
MIRVLIALMLLAAGGSASAQTNDRDAAVQAVYASIENNIRREYDAILRVVSRKEAESPTGHFEKMRDVVRIMYYNKAAVFSDCTAEAEQYRTAGAPRVPASQNLVLGTCLEENLGELNKFSNMLGYATTFFPDRIEPCGEASRLHDREKLLPPYEFLQLTEPKLYDFTRYNSCLMKNEAISPAAR